MSDSSGSGDPYQPPSQQQPPPYPPPQSSPYGQPPGESAPEQPAAPQQPAQPQQPFGQPQQPQQPQYGQPQYGAPSYPQQGYGQPQYGYGQPAYGYAGDPDKRPGTVTAAGVITIIMSALVALLCGFLILGVSAARDEFVDGMRAGGDLQGLDPEGLASGFLVGSVVVLVWCLIAIVLAIFAMRRSNGARIGLVVSSVITAILSVLGAIGAVVPGLWTIGAIAVIICLFTGGAGDWYARQPGTAPGSAPPTHRGPVA